MAKGKLALGLDIGSTSVKMILLKEQRKRGQVSYALQSFGMKPLPPEAIVDGALMNSTAIVQAMQELLTELKIKQQGSRHRRLRPLGHHQEDLDAPHEPGGARGVHPVGGRAVHPLRCEGREHRHADPATPGGNDATGQMDVLLVAAKKDMINDYTTVVSEAGLLPVVVDVDAFAVQNMFAVQLRRPREGDGGADQRRRLGGEHQHHLQRHHGLHPRRDHRRQPVHRGDPEAAQRLLRGGRGAEDRRRRAATPTRSSPRRSSG